jgi:DNA-binding MarR family transcriptional regulator
MKDLNPILHSRLRLAIMALLTANDEVTFPYVVEKTDASRGNVSVQITNLEEAGYLEVTKTFEDKKPKTTLQITEEGKAAMQEYTDALKDYLKL